MLATRRSCVPHMVSLPKVLRQGRAVLRFDHIRWVCFPTEFVLRYLSRSTNKAAAGVKACHVLE